LPSRFVLDIPDEYIEKLPKREAKRIDYDFEESFGEKTKNYSGVYGRSSAPVTSKRPIPAAKTPSIAPKPAAASSLSYETYKVGEAVTHKAFGRGMVLSSTKVGPDTMVEIAFESSGTKSLCSL
jgi:DNA helicase-2/ATP-dependent DNA helicase PcrA